MPKKNNHNLFKTMLNVFKRHFSICEILIVLIIISIIITITRHILIVHGLPKAITLFPNLVVGVEVAVGVAVGVAISGFMWCFDYIEPVLQFVRNLYPTSVSNKISDFFHAFLQNKITLGDNDKPFDSKSNILQRNDKELSGSQGSDSEGSDSEGSTNESKKKKRKITSSSSKQSDSKQLSTYVEAKELYDKQASVYYQAEKLQKKSNELSDNNQESLLSENIKNALGINRILNNDNNGMSSKLRNTNEQTTKQTSLEISNKTTEINPMSNLLPSSLNNTYTPEKIHKSTFTYRNFFDKTNYLDVSIISIKAEGRQPIFLNEKHIAYVTYRKGLRPNTLVVDKIETNNTENLGYSLVSVCHLHPNNTYTLQTKNVEKISSMLHHEIEKKYEQYPKTISFTSDHWLIKALISGHNKVRPKNMTWI